MDINEIRDRALRFLNEERNVTSDNLENYLKEMNGRIVFIGYINEISKISQSRRYANAENSAQLTKHYDEGGKILKKFLGDTPQSVAKWVKDPTGKTTNFNLNTEGVSIVSYTLYKMNWLSNEDVAEIERKKEEAKQALRKEHGFGEDHGENDWRNKTTTDKSGKTSYVYGGNSILSNQTNKSKGTIYTISSQSSEQNGWESNSDTIKDRAWRQRPEIFSRKYFAIDKETGEVESVSDDFMTLMDSGFKAKKVEKVKAELEADEAAYVNALAELNARPEFASAITLLESKTLWMSYTPRSKGDAPQPKTWINSELMSKYSTLIDYIPNLRKKLTPTDNISELYDRNIKPVLEFQERLNRI